jgi:hypothetical protein
MNETLAAVDPVVNEDRNQKLLASFMANEVRRAQGLSQDFTLVGASI